MILIEQTAQPKGEKRPLQGRWKGWRLLWRRNWRWVLWRGRNPGCGERWEIVSQVHRNKHEEKSSPKPWLRKGEGLNFLSFCNQWGSKTGVSKVPRLGSDRDLRTALYSCSTPGAEAGKRSQADCINWESPKGHRERQFILFWSTSMRGGVASPWTKEQPGAISLSLSINQIQQTAQNQYWLSNLLTLSLPRCAPPVWLFSGKSA